MKTKKGSFELIGGKTIGILIALMCILILMYLGYKIASVRSEYENLKRAEAIIDEVTTIAANLDVGEYKDYIIPSLNEWIFYSTYQSLPKPLSCVDEKDKDTQCLCLCPLADEDSKIPFECYSGGTCKKIVSVNGLAKKANFVLEGWKEGERPLYLLVGAPVKQEETQTTEQRRLQQQSLIRIKRLSEELYGLSYVDKERIEEVQRSEDKKIDQLIQEEIPAEQKLLNSQVTYPTIAIKYEKDPDWYIVRWNPTIGGGRVQLITSLNNGALEEYWTISQDLRIETIGDSAQQSHINKIMTSRTKEEFVKNFLEIARLQTYQIPGVPNANPVAITPFIIREKLMTGDSNFGNTISQKMEIIKGISEEELTKELSK